MGSKPWSKAIGCAVAVVCAGVLCAGCAAPQDDSASPLVNGVTDQQGVVYCLYFGLADKDTGRQELGMAEAKDLLIPLFVEAGSGYTVYEAEGGYAADDGTIVQNDTLVFDGTHGDEQAILALIDQAKQTLNIESVYCETKEVGYKIYGGVVAGVE